MLVDAAHARVAKQHATAAVGLQAVLVGIDDDGVSLVDAGESGAGIGVQVVHQPEVAAVGRIHVDAEIVLLSEGENRRQRIHRTGARGTDGGDDGSNLAVLEPLFQGVHVHAPAFVYRDTGIVELQHL